MLLIDTKEKTIIQDVELKMNIANAHPYTQWLNEQVRKSRVFFLLLSIRNNAHIFKRCVCASDIVTVINTVL